MVSKECAIVYVSLNGLENLENSVISLNYTS